MNFTRLIGLMGVSGAIAACSADGEMLFGAPPSGAVTGSGGSTTSGGNGGATASGNGGATSSSADAATTTASSTSASTSAASTSAASSSAASTSAASTSATTATASSSTAVASSSVVASSSSGMPVQNTIPCGTNLTCNLDAGEACCWDSPNLLDGPQNKCVTGSLDQDGCNTMQVGFGPETRIECQDEGDCAGNKICCARRKQFFANGKQYAVYDQVTCEDTCAYKFNAQNFLLCIPDVTACPLLPGNNNQWVQSVCKASQLLPSGYNVCGYP